MKAYSFLDLREAAVTPQVVRELQELDREKTKHIEALKDEIAKKERDLHELRGSTVSKADFANFQSLVFKELGKKFGREIGQAATAKKEEPST